jgi:hypothetical protein
MWVSNAPVAPVQRRSSCPLHELLSAEDYLTAQILTSARPGSRILSSRQLPEFSNAQKQQLERSHPAPLNFGDSVSASVDSVRIDFEYLDEGQTLHESLLGSIFSWRSRYDLWPLFNKGPKWADYFWITASDIYASRPLPEDSPSGIAVLARILVSLRENPRWQAGRGDVIEKVQQRRLTPSEPLPAGNTDGVTEKKIAESYRLQAHSQLARARLYDPAVLPAETFIHPITKESVELNGGFAFAWTDDKDGYILTNDPNFNPAEKFKEHWTQLQHPAPQQ